MTVAVVLLSILVVLLLAYIVRLRRTLTPVDEKISFEKEYDQLSDAARKANEELEQREAQWREARDKLITAYEAELASVRLEYAEKKRADAKLTASRSRTSLVAKVAEHFAPYLNGFKYNPKEARHIGEIIDFIVYDGLEAGGPVEVVFLEVKTKANGRVSNPRERLVRDAIVAGRVRYEVFVPQAAIAAKAPRGAIEK